MGSNIPIRDSGNRNRTRLRIRWLVFALSVFWVLLVTTKDHVSSFFQDEAPSSLIAPEPSPLNSSDSSHPKGFLVVESPSFSAGKRRDNPPVLKPFDPGRFRFDPLYRAFVWEHMLHWDLQLYREAGETVIDQITDLWREFGLPEQLMTQPTRDALQAIAQYQFYLNASKVDESARSEFLASLRTAGLSADDVARSMQGWEMAQEATGQLRRGQAEEEKRFYTRHLERETGITNQDFYSRLFELKPTTSIGPLRVHPAENQPILAP